MPCTSVVDVSSRHSHSASSSRTTARSMCAVVGSSAGVGLQAIWSGLGYVRVGMGKGLELALTLTLTLTLPPALTLTQITTEYGCCDIVMAAPLQRALNAYQNPDPNLRVRVRDRVRVGVTGW